MISVREPTKQYGAVRAVDDLSCDVGVGTVTGLANLPYGWAIDLSAALPGSRALSLVVGDGPSDHMTTTFARLTLTAWALAALVAGGWRLLGTDATR